eukprot:TRINITY_DN6730_c0_g1_i6.p2 TRINITY_DN6730_c0_g1~~TRINITY_DN6730_c0_g1_i6.p2  ORF type:complete len:110 (-),score=4.10 TRINITY_DN6730_c0_g1_i6:239-538(-)
MLSLGAVLVAAVVVPNAKADLIEDVEQIEKHNYTKFISMMQILINIILNSNSDVVSQDGSQVLQFQLQNVYEKIVTHSCLLTKNIYFYIQFNVKYLRDY